MKITSSPPRNLGDFILDDWSDIPLDHISTICPSSLKAIPLTNFRRLAGNISDNDWDKVMTALESL